MLKQQEELLRQRMAGYKEEEEEMSPTLQVTWMKNATPYSRQLLNDIFSKVSSTPTLSHPPPPPPPPPPHSMGQ